MPAAQIVIRAGMVLPSEITTASGLTLTLALLTTLIFWEASLCVAAFTSDESRPCSM